jgi:hypothetical protein
MDDSRSKRFQYGLGSLFALTLVVALILRFASDPLLWFVVIQIGCMNLAAVLFGGAALVHILRQLRRLAVRLFGKVEHPN